MSNVPPLVLNIFKPAGPGSFDVIRYLKKNLPGDYGKIGHFGTLDPFACGVLLVAIGGATKLNEFVHEFMPKTYLGIGKLGVHTETGDLTVPPQMKDDSDYFKERISTFSKEFIQDKLIEKFIGVYQQVPPQYSATKFQGRPLHEWAREGVEIKKAPVPRNVYSIEVVKYVFPYLSVRVTVSSGTYVRTLFQDFAKYLGTYGTLVSLVREKIGHLSCEDSIKKNAWDAIDYDQTGIAIDQVLRFNHAFLPSTVAQKYQNGIPFSMGDVILLEKGEIHNPDYYWVYDENKKLLGLGKQLNDQVSVVFNLRTE